MKRGFAIVTGMVLGLSLCSMPAGAERNHGGKWVYKITITNVTKGMDLSQGMVFTPILLATHKPGVNVFELGQPPSEALARLAEGGDTGPLSDILLHTHGVQHVVTTDAPLLPGESVEVEIPYGGRGTVLSLASMLLPTNDGFIGLTNGALPVFRRQTVSHTLVGYDAGSEINDELCISIPGPHCGGEGYSPDGGEGKTHVHSGIHDVGDLPSDAYDWRNPVATVNIQLDYRS